MARHLAALTALTVGAGLCVSSAQAQMNDQTAQETDMRPAALKVLTRDDIGSYLTDRSGRSVYMFQKDTQGARASTCYDACADAWPPMLAKTTVLPGLNIEPDRIGMFEREDGNWQVTYDGWPLYYFARDTRIGHIKGQDVEGFGAEWYLVAPDGSIVHAEKEREAAMMEGEDRETEEDETDGY